MHLFDVGGRRLRARKVWGQITLEFITRSRMYRGSGKTRLIPAKLLSPLCTLSFLHPFRPLPRSVIAESGASASSPHVAAAQRSRGCGPSSERKTCAPGMSSGRHEGVPAGHADAEPRESLYGRQWAGMGAPGTLGGVRRQESPVFLSGMPKASSHARGPSARLAEGAAGCGESSRKCSRHRLDYGRPLRAGLCSRAAH